jgi:hypothetical protein
MLASPDKKNHEPIQLKAFCPWPDHNGADWIAWHVLE